MARRRLDDHTNLVGDDVDDLAAGCPLTHRRRDNVDRFARREPDVLVQTIGPFLRGLVRRERLAGDRVVAVFVFDGDAERPALITNDGDESIALVGESTGDLLVEERRFQVVAGDIVHVAT